MTIDERLEKLAERHEALSQSVEGLTHDVREMREAMIAMDARERRGREALLKGIVAYLEALNENGEPGGQS